MKESSKILILEDNNANTRYPHFKKIKIYILVTSKKNQAKQFKIDEEY